MWVVKQPFLTHAVFCIAGTSTWRSSWKKERQGEPKRTDTAAVADMAQIEKGTETRTGTATETELATETGIGIERAEMEIENVMGAIEHGQGLAIDERAGTKTLTGNQAGGLDREIRGVSLSLSQAAVWWVGSCWSIWGKQLAEVVL